MDDHYLSINSAHSIRSYSCEELSTVHSRNTLTNAYNEEEEGTETLPPHVPLPDPPDGGWGWVIVISTFFIHFIGEGIMNSFGVLLVNLSENFPTYPKSVLSLIGSCSVGIPAVMAPVAAALINRYGVRSVTLAGGFISGIGCCFTFFAPTPIEIIILFGVCTGFGQSLCLTAALVVVAQYFSKQRAFALGLSISGMGLGSVLFPLIIDWLLDFYFWQGTMLILSGFYFNLMVFGSFLRSIETKSVCRQRRLLVRLESFSRKSGINLCEEDHYKSGSVDQKIELIKDALTNPQLLPTDDFNTGTFVDAAADDDDCGIVMNDLITREENELDADELIFIPERKNIPFITRSSSEDSQSEYEDIKNLKYCVVNIPYVKDIIPLNGAYRLMLPEQTLVTIHEDEIINFDEEPLQADNSSLVGKSNADCYSACLDLSNPNLVDDSLSKSKRSLQKSGEIEKLDEYERGDSMERKKKKFTNFRNWKSLENVHNSSCEGKSSANGSRSIFRTNSDPELLRILEQEDSRYDALFADDQESTEAVNLLSYSSPSRESSFIEKSPDITASELEILQGRKAKTHFKRKQKSHRQFHRDVGKEFPHLNSPNNELESLTTKVLDSGDERAPLKADLRSREKYISTHIVSPFERKDIFFRRSIEKLLECNRTSRALSLPNLHRPQQLRVNLKRKGECKCPRILRNNGVVKLLKSIMDPQIFLYWPFTILIFSNVLLFLSSLPVLIYIGMWAKQWNLKQERIAEIYTILGVTNTLSQIFVGWLADFKSVNTLCLYIVLIIIHGAATCFLPLFRTYLSISVFAGIYGLSIAANDSLISVIALEIVGLNKLTNGIGLVYFGQGVAFIAGPPLLGLLMDSMGQYELCFFLSGLMIVISGLILIPVVIYQLCRNVNKPARDEDKLIEAHLLEDVPVNQRNEQLTDIDISRNGGSHNIPHQMEV